MENKRYCCVKKKKIKSAFQYRTTYGFSIFFIASLFLRYLKYLYSPMKTVSNFCWFYQKPQVQSSESWKPLLQYSYWKVFEKPLENSWRNQQKIVIPSGFGNSFRWALAASRNFFRTAILWLSKFLKPWGIELENTRGFHKNCHN